MPKDKKLTINDAWAFLFDKHDIVKEVNKKGHFRIDAKEINTVKEARLMAKFDQSSQLPAVFKENGLSILPVTRGAYIIGKYQTHFPITYKKVKPEYVRDPCFETLDSRNLYSESSALLFAYNSDIMKHAMNADKINFTVSGRMSSGEFEYNIRNTEAGVPQKISVKNAQIEIDGGYESNECFCICEAKNIAAEELLIRQLYYPYRLWETKISKPIVPIFFVYSNDIFNIFIFKFEDLHDYNSIKLVEQKSYTFENEEIPLSELFERSKIIKPYEPDVTFPQANSFERIIDLVSLLYVKNLTRDEVTYRYEFRDRQTNYYIDACVYLNLVEKFKNEDNEITYKLTKQARNIMDMRYKEKYLALMCLILSRPVFKKVFELAFVNGEVPDMNLIKRIMAEAEFARPLNKTTIARRASTVKGWIDWMLSHCNLI